MNNAKETDAGRHSFNVGWTVVCVLAIPLAYLLSTGPVLKLSDAHPRLIIQLFYVPVGCLCEESPKAAKAMDWYVHTVWKVD